jgi:cell wall-associated protease
MLLFQKCTSCRVGDRVGVHSKEPGIGTGFAYISENCEIMREKLNMMFLLLGFLLTSPCAIAQDAVPKDWFVKDPEIDKVQGVSADRVYESLLKGQPSKTVTVAVIDGGVDITHEDLKSVIWTNEDEIAGNGVDDDKNGYIDDVHGWNFIGGKDANVGADTYELTREYKRLNEKFAAVENGGKVPKKQKAEYEQYLKIKDKFEKLKAKNERMYENIRSFYMNYANSVDTLKYVLDTDTLTIEKVEAYNPTEPVYIFAKGIITTMVRNVGEDLTLEELRHELEQGYEELRTIVEFGYNPDFDSRLIVGDNYSDLYEKGYGNNDVAGPDAQHGTHVAGIIAADRTNDIGIRGIASNVRIMSVRAVPNGDERDKDVANAIIYAVDNGAQVINMSFGKSYSPEKIAVDKAVKYAEQKGVLLVHAAGNDGANNDEKPNFPNRVYLDGKEARNWLEIGASSFGSDEDFVGGFSNYGKKSVDVFAPGVEIYSTTPGNTYEELQGTSMAAPMVAGVAALLIAYFPDLSMVEVRDILRNSSRKFDGLKVQTPGGKGKENFSDLSISGGLINAYEAVKMAQMMMSLKSAK